jgi:hypothetical protein
MSDPDPEAQATWPPKRRQSDTRLTTVLIPAAPGSKPAVSWRLVLLLLLIAAAVIVIGYFVIDRVVFARRVMVVSQLVPAIAPAPGKSLAALSFRDLSAKRSSGAPEAIYKPSSLSDG